MQALKAGTQIAQSGTRVCRSGNSLQRLVSLAPGISKPNEHASALIVQPRALMPKLTWRQEVSLTPIQTYARHASLTCLALSYLVLSSPVMSCPVLSHPALLCLVLSRPVLSCLVLSDLALPCFVMSWFGITQMRGACIGHRSARHVIKTTWPHIFFWGGAGRAQVFRPQLNAATLCLHCV